MSTYTRERLVPGSRPVVVPHFPEECSFAAPTPEARSAQPQVWVLTHGFTELSQLGIEQWLVATFEGVVKPARIGMAQLVESCENRGTEQYEDSVIVVPKELWGEDAAGIADMCKRLAPQAECWFL